MSYLSDLREWQDNARAAREANPLCDESATCPAPDDGHLLGCRGNRARLAAAREQSCSHPCQSWPFCPCGGGG